MTEYFYQLTTVAHNEPHPGWNMQSYDGLINVLPGQTRQELCTALINGLRAQFPIPGNAAVYLNHLAPNTLDQS